ncbi:MAG: membrane dipeptidase [Clostridia bacterium]|nr:membrane dipeptidase [Clostridia bacterium]
MNYSLFDLHCDTAYRMLTEHQPFAANDFAVSAEKAKDIETYVQVMALWIDHRASDAEGWSLFWRMLENLRRDPSLSDGTAAIAEDLPSANAKITMLLALEDARILENDLSRVDLLAKAGIRILTPMWRGETCMGGAHDTQSGLTDFGRLAMRRAMTLGMIPDISHASRRSAEDIFSLAAESGSPVIASHSNAYSICPVTRNLLDREVAMILSSGGVIGLNFYVGFLKENGKATAADLFPHIEHFLSLGAERALCLGGDMDGCDLPCDLQGIDALPNLAESMLSHNYPETLVRAILFDNAYTFAKRHLFQKA